MVITSMSLPILSVLATSDSEGNDYPIILVHGLAGGGDGEMLDVKYWGGQSDIESYLNNNGHTTLTATVGPVSSNWDRAIELYYYIKGGTVDYGAKHAEEHTDMNDLVARILEFIRNGMVKAKFISSVIVWVD